MHELRGLRRRAAREVVPLDERGAQAPARGVERDAAPGDAAADDEDVELVLLQAGERVGASRTWASGQVTGRLRSEALGRARRRGQRRLPIGDERRRGIRPPGTRASRCARPGSAPATARRSTRQRTVEAHQRTHRERRSRRGVSKVWLTSERAGGGGAEPEAVRGGAVAEVPAHRRRRFRLDVDASARTR